MYLNVCIVVLFAALSPSLEAHNLYAYQATELKCGFEAKVTPENLKELNKDIHVISKNSILRDYFACVLEKYGAEESATLLRECASPKLPAGVTDRPQLIKSMNENCDAHNKRECEISWKVVLCEIDFLNGKTKYPLVRKGRDAK